MLFKPVTSCLLIFLFAVSCESHGPAQAQSLPPADQKTSATKPSSIMEELAPVSNAVIAVKDRSAQLSLEGHFPNSCYSWDHARVSRDARNFRVQAFVHIRKGMCLMMLVPYSQSVELGEGLEPGAYRVEIERRNGTSIEKSFTIH
jgi:hypothetical protein